VKISNLENTSSVNSGATSADIEETNQKFGYSLHEDYVLFLEEANGFMLENGLHMYSTADLFERNVTLEVQEYAPGYTAIGDDSGGMSITIEHATGEIFSVDQASMDPDDMEKLANSIGDWLNVHCKF